MALGGASMLSKPRYIARAARPFARRSAAGIPPLPRRQRKTLPTSPSSPSSSSPDHAPPSPPPRGPPRLPPTAALPPGGGSDGGGGDGSSSSSSSGGGWIRVTFVLVGLAAAALAAAPTALSSRPGTGLLLQIIKRLFLSATSEVEVESLSLSWRRPPVVKGLKVIDRGQEPAAEGGGSERKRGGSRVVSSSSPLPSLFSSSPPPSSSLTSPSSSSSSLPETETSGSVVAAAEAVSASRSLATIAFTKRSFEVVVSRPFVDLFPTADGRTSRVARALKGGGGEDGDDDEEDGELIFEPEAVSAASSSSTVTSEREQLPSPLGPAAGLRFSAEARGGLGRGRKGAPSFSFVVVGGRARVPLDLKEALGESVHAVALVGEEALLSEGAEMLTFRGKESENDNEGDDAAADDDDDNDDDDNAGVNDDGIISGVSPSSPLAVPYDASWASRWRNASASRSRQRRRGSAQAEKDAEEGAPPLLLSRRAGRAAVPAAFEVRSDKAAVAADGWLLLPPSSYSSAASSSRKKKAGGGSSSSSGKAPFFFVLRKPAAARAALTTPLVKHCLSRLSPLLADAVAVGGGGSGGGSARDGSVALPALAATLSPANAVLFPRFSRAVLRVEPLLVELRKSEGGTGVASRALGWLDRAAAAASAVSAVSGNGSGGDGGGGGGIGRRFPFGGGGGGSSLSSALSSSPSLVAWTSPAELDLRVSRRGGVAVGVRRIDVLVGPPERRDKKENAGGAVVVTPDRSRSARFATWGTVDAEGRRLALTLGIPAETLKRAAGGASGGTSAAAAAATPSPSPSSPSPSPSSPSPSPAPSPSPSPSWGKLSHVPDDSMLCVDIGGSLDAPRVDFAGAAARLAELAALSSAAEVSSSSAAGLLASHPLSAAEKDLSASSSSFVSPAVAAVKKMFWRKAAERARGGGSAAGPSSVPGSGGTAVPAKGCGAFPWEETATEKGGGRRRGGGGSRRRLGQREAVLLRQDEQRKRAVFDER